MKRGALYLVALLLVAAAVAAGVFVFLNRDNDKKTGNISSSVSQTAKTSNKACSLLTLADAKQLLGPNAKGGPNAQVSSSADLDISYCIYTQGVGNKLPVSANKTATLLVTAPKTEKGAASNQNQFGRLRPANVQDVGGYGEAAYWDPVHGQLNVLKNNVWYIMSYGPVQPAGRTLEETKQLADLLTPKL
jgi:hypothetical protein